MTTLAWACFFEAGLIHLEGLALTEQRPNAA
jgi:hypothetical protein